jgi:hypothetical protein
MRTNIFSRQSAPYPQNHTTLTIRFRSQIFLSVAALLPTLAVLLFPGSARAQLFTYDHGTANTLGGEPNGDILALNHFTTGGSPVLITEIGVLWNPLSANVHPTVALYSDPNGLGNPSGMQPLLLQPIYIPPGVVVLNNTSIQYYSTILLDYAHDC